MGKFSVNGDLVVVSHGFIWFKGDFFLVRYLFFFGLFRDSFLWSLKP